MKGIRKLIPNVFHYFATIRDPVTCIIHRSHDLCPRQMTNLDPAVSSNIEGSRKFLSGSLVFLESAVNSAAARI